MIRILQRCFTISLALLFVLVWYAPTDVLAARKHRISAASAILLRSSDLRSIYGKEIHKKVLPASTTKVMTAILVLERLRLDAVVTVSKRASKALPTKIYVKPGEKYRVRDLLYALLLKSANDAAIVLAEAVAGSEYRFVRMMNKRARELGARRTRFANAHGLPSKEEQYTTAYDMAVIFREAMRHDLFREGIRYKYKRIQSVGGRTIKLKSHNKSLFKNWKQNVYGKTGYTNAAKACFVGYIRHKGQTMIVAIFGCTTRWEDLKYVVERYAKVAL